MWNWQTPSSIDLYVHTAYSCKQYPLYWPIFLCWQRKDFKKGRIFGISKFEQNVILPNLLNLKQNYSSNRNFFSEISCQTYCVNSDRGKLSFDCSTKGFVYKENDFKNMQYFCKELIDLVKRNLVFAVRLEKEIQVSKICELKVFIENRQ